MTKLKPVPQFILLAPDHTMRSNTLTGDKEITLREGHRDYRPGLAFIGCEKVPWVVSVDITDVRHCTLREVTKEEWEADGFTSQQHLLEGMRGYYPNLTLDSPVTAVRWTNVRGYLADQADVYKATPWEVYDQLAELHING